MVPNPDELQQLSELYKAMGDYTRMRILWHLMEKDCCVSELAEKLQTTKSAVSHQLRALRMTRLVCSCKSGKRSSIPYRMNTSDGFWKKPTHIFQSVNSAAPAFLSGAAPTGTVLFTVFRRKPTGLSGYAVCRNGWYPQAHRPNNQPPEC